MVTCRPCKPGSVPEADSGPLSFIYDGSRLPPPATYPPASGEQPLIAGIHGLATHGTYGRTTSLPPRWALTPPFHPYRSEIPGDAPCLSLCGRPMAPDAFTGGCFLLRSHDLTAIKSLACVALCVARTFLSRPTAGSDRAGLRCKDREFSGKFVLFGKGICSGGGRRFAACRPLAKQSCSRPIKSSSPSGTPCRAGSGTGGRNAAAHRRRPGGAKRRRNSPFRGSGPCPSSRRRRRAAPRWRCA